MRIQAKIVTLDKMKKEVKMIRKCRGLSLVEVLISIAILSIGLLALAKAQILTLSYDEQSYFKSLALIRLQSMVARLRVDSKHLQNQISIWNKLNHQALPAGKGKVSGSNPYHIILNWKEKSHSQRLSITTRI